jgi:hypothetical protein
LTGFLSLYARSAMKNTMAAGVSMTVVCSEGAMVHLIPRGAVKSTMSVCRPLRK